MKFKWTSGFYVNQKCLRNDIEEWSELWIHELLDFGIHISWYFQYFSSSTFVKWEVRGQQVRPEMQNQPLSEER